jgi:folate-dependent phosphoribosylglycinamide formyltransferase PurN
MNRQKGRACFAGTRLEAFRALQRNYEVKSVLTLPGSRVHQQCADDDFPVQLISPGEKKDRKEAAFKFLTQQSVDLVLSAGFPFILPGSLLQSGPTFINSHPSLLPAYPGYNAIKEAFKNQEEYLGVTVHFMVEEVDAGQQIHQETVWVKGLTLPEVYHLLFGMVEPRAITRALDLLARANS